MSRLLLLSLSLSFALLPLACFKATDFGNDEAETSESGSESPESGSESPTTNDSQDGNEAPSTDPSTDPTTDPTEGMGEAWCGNGVIDAGEQCDGMDLGGASCGDVGKESGTLGCAGDCTFDGTACYTCGDGLIEGGEKCDGSNLADQTCITQGFVDGTLQCAADCMSFDPSACISAPNCGNGVVEDGEQCDGSVGDQTCESLGYGGGTLSCSGACLYETSGCFACGDGVLQAGEECDGGDFGGLTCQSYGYDIGFLDCYDCVIDSSNCCNWPCNLP
jgi:hypothetical protein